MPNIRPNPLEEHLSWEALMSISFSSSDLRRLLNTPQSLHLYLGFPEPFFTIFVELQQEQVCDFVIFFCKYNKNHSLFDTIWMSVIIMPKSCSRLMAF